MPVANAWEDMGRAAAVLSHVSVVPARGVVNHLTWGATAVKQLERVLFNPVMLSTCPGTIEQLANLGPPTADPQSSESVRF